MLRSTLWLLLVLVPQWAAADRLVTVGGQELEGEAEVGTLVLSVEEGQIELPRSSMLEIRPSGENLTVRLVDGSWVEGRPEGGTVAIRGELFTRRLPWSEVRLVQLELDLEAATAAPSVFVRVDDIPRQHSSVERPPPLRLELDLEGVYELPAEKRSVWTSSKLRLFYANDASIPVVQVKKSVDREGFVTVELEVSIAVRESYDRMIELKFDLLAEGFAGWRKRDRFEVEEGRIRRRKYYLRLSKEAFEGVFQPSSRPRIRFQVEAEEA